MHISIYAYMYIYVYIYICIYVYICVCMNTPGFRTWRFDCDFSNGDPVVFNGVSNVGDPIVGYGCYKSTHVRDGFCTGWLERQPG